MSALPRNAVIEATAIVDDPAIRSSIELAAAAGRDAIAAAGLAVGDIDLLINVGVYRDNNMVEPAMAALIQRELGLNLDYVKNPTRKAAFGVDLMNGACGIFNAISVARSFIATGDARHVLIVSSDIHPSMTQPADFPYVPVGAAMIVGASDRPGAGFGRLSVRDGGGSSTVVEGSAITPDDLSGRHNLAVVRHPEFAERLLELAAASAREYAAAEGIDLARTLLVTSQITPDFGARLAAALGARAAGPTGVDGDPHSSAITVAWHAAAARGEPSSYDQVLFVGAGAGPTAACAVYRP